MRRMWFGVAVLLLLLGTGIGIHVFMKHTHCPSGAIVQQAAAFAEEGNWTQARLFRDRAWEKWQKNWHVTAAIADHEPMDQVDALFAELAFYAKQEDMLSFCGGCAYLAELLESMGTSNEPNWWNLL